MRVLVIGHDTRSSGIAAYTIELAKILRRMDYEVYLLTFQDITIEGIEVMRVDDIRVPSYMPLFRGLMLSKVLRQSVRNVAPDIVHETLTPLALGISNVVTTVYGYVSYTKLAWIRTSMLPFPQNLGGFPVTVQHLIGDILSRRNARRAIHTTKEVCDFIPPPVELRKLKEYGKQDPLNLLFVSRDLRIRRKNLDVILHAISSVRREIILHLVGKNPPSLSHISHEVISHGYLSRVDLFSLMAEVDVLLLPSFYEEIGYVGLEANSMGLPVVASDIESFRKNIPKSIFFSPYDDSALSRILESVDHESLKHIGINSREYIKESNEVSMTRLAAVYGDILRNLRSKRVQT